MSTTVDIVGIAERQIEYPVLDESRFEATFDKYITIAKKVIKTFAPRYKPGLDSEMIKSEDAVSNIATAIMIADWRWNPKHRSKDGKVRTQYAYRNQCGIWAIQGYIARQTRAKKPLSLESVVSSSDAGSALLLKDVLPDDEERGPVNNACTNEDYKMCGNILEDSKLTEKQRDCIRLYYIDDLTYQEIADQYGVTREAVRQVIDRATDKIRNRGEKAYNG